MREVLYKIRLMLMGLRVRVEREKYALQELASLHFGKACVEPSNCWSDFTIPPVRWDPIAVV